MRHALIAAERSAEVRHAARAWKTASLIDEGALSAIEQLYPDDRVRLGPVWRVLVFIFVSLASGAVIGFMALGIRGGIDFALLMLVCGATLAVATEVQQGPYRFSGTGSEAATSFLSVLLLSIACTHWIYIAINSFVRSPEGIPPEEKVFFLTGFVLWALASWRWGYPLYAVFSAIFLCLGAAFFSGQARPAVATVTIALAAAAAPNLDRPSLAPSHRRAFEWTLGVALVALYAAINRYSIDAKLLEEVLWVGRPSRPAAAGLKTAAAIATALFPLLVLAWGIWSRRRVILVLGGLFVVLSLATLRFYVHLAPLWLVLGIGGGAAVALALAIERALACAPGRERLGFTAEPLFEPEERNKLLETAAVVGTLTPAPPQPPPDDRRFSGGGGDFGGGGASGTFD